MRLTFFLSISLFAGYCFAQNDTVSKRSTEKIFQIVEQMPEFPGGENALNAYLKGCPSGNNKIEGAVFVRFIIEVDGKISNVEIAKGADQKLNEAAMECVKKMPDWKP